MVKNSNVFCPYHCNFKQRYTRLIYHLAKGCPNMKNYDYEICMYNWVHRVPKGTLDEHHSVCEYKPQPSKDEFSNKVNPQAWISGPWNSFLYDRSFPPEFFPDY